MDDRTDFSNKKNTNLINFRSYWFWIIVASVIAFTVYLGYKVGIAIAFAFLSVAIATFFSSRSLAITGRSLETTRATTRPFLDIRLNLVTGGMNPDRAIFEIEIENTGNLPADKVNVDCSWYIGESENAKQYLIELEKPIQSIVFPANKGYCTYLVKGSENVSNIAHKGSRVIVTANYQNKLTAQPYATRRIFRIAFASTPNSSYNRPQAIVIPEEDYWD